MINFIRRSHLLFTSSLSFRKFGAGRLNVEALTSVGEFLLFSSDLGDLSPYLPAFCSLSPRLLRDHFTNLV